MHSNIAMNIIILGVPITVLNSCYNQAHRQGGVRGGSLEPPFWPPKDIMHRLAVHFKYPTVQCKWSTSFTAIENHRCPNEFGCSYAPCGTCTQVVSLGTRLVSGLRGCDERTRVNTCVNT